MSGLAAKEPDVANFISFEGAVDESDLSGRVDSEFFHQQSLSASVKAKS